MQGGSQFGFIGAHSSQPSASARTYTHDVGSVPAPAFYGCASQPSRSAPTAAAAALCPVGTGTRPRFACIIRFACINSSSSRRRLKPNIKLDSKGQPGADADGGYDEAYGSDDGSDVDQDLASLFDYEQCFPTTLPLSLHHPCDDEADAAADAAVMRRGLPEELALKEVRGCVCVSRYALRIGSSCSCCS